MLGILLTVIVLAVMVVTCSTPLRHAIGTGTGTTIPGCDHNDGTATAESGAQHSRCLGVPGELRGH